MQSEISQLGKSPFLYEDVGKRGVANGTLQLKHCHLSHRLFIAPKSADQLADVEVLHGGNGVVLSPLK